MIFLIFSFIVLLIFGLANVYIYKRLIKKITLFKYFYKIFSFIFIVLFLAQAVFLIFRRDEYLSDTWYEIFSHVLCADLLFVFYDFSMGFC